MLPGKMDNADNKIQIITNSEIRYRGTLYQVNPTDKTIALREVISYGTELRRTDRVIPPVQTVYDCIVFRSTDIKELEVVGPAGPEEGESDPKLNTQNTGVTDDNTPSPDGGEATQEGGSKADPQEKTAGEGNNSFLNALLDDADRNPQLNQEKSQDTATQE
jgi:hypothetical protein